MKQVSTRRNFARPTRSVRRSKYDEFLDAALQIAPGEGKGVVETFESQEKAQTYLNGLRGRRHNRKLGEVLDVWMTTDGLSVVLAPYDNDSTVESAE